MQTSIQDVKAQHEAELMAMPGVVSVGIGLDDEGNQLIVVGVEQDKPETHSQVPQTIDGHAVRIDVVGRLKAQ